MKLIDVEMTVQMNKDNKVIYSFYSYDEKGKQVRIDPKRIPEEDKKYVKAKFAQVLKKTVNDWNDIWK